MFSVYSAFTTTELGLEMAYPLSEVIMESGFVGLVL